MNANRLSMTVYRCNCHGFRYADPRHCMHTLPQNLTSSIEQDVLPTGETSGIEEIRRMEQRHRSELQRVNIFFAGMIVGAGIIAGIVFLFL